MDPNERLLWLIAIYNAGRIDTATFRVDYLRLWSAELDPASLSAWVWMELSGVASALAGVFSGDISALVDTPDGTWPEVDEATVRALVAGVQERLPAGLPLVRADSAETPKVQLLDDMCAEVSARAPLARTL